MRWFRQKGKSKFESCVELVIDFDGQKAAFGTWDNYPKDPSDTEAKARKEAKIFTFDEIGGESFRAQFSYLPESGFDYFFDAGANDEFYRVLKMSKADYIAQNYDRKEIIVDQVEDKNSCDTRHGATYRVVYSEGRYGIVYDCMDGAVAAKIPDVSGSYDIYEEVYDRGIFTYSSTAKIGQDKWNLSITFENVNRQGTFSEVSNSGYVKITLRNGVIIYLNLVDRTMNPNYAFFD